MKATHSVVTVTLKEEDLLAKGVTMAADLRLPSEIVEEILAWLPDKTIYRLRSVSKSWSSLLVSVNFHKFRLKSTPPEINVPKILRAPDRKNDGFVILDYRDGVKTPIKVCYPALPRELFPAIRNLLIGSCNGIVCLALEWEQIVVWNPFTGSYRKLPDISRGGWTYHHTYGFGYDSASDDYKVPGKKMKNLDERYLRYIQPGHKGLFLNGALHWESWGNGSFFHYKKIIAFDLSTEKFYDIAGRTPAYGYYGYGHHCLGVVGEYLCICFPINHLDRNIVWVMKEYCNEASWVHFFSYSTIGLVSYLNFELDFARDFVQQSFKDAGYMILQCPSRYVDVLKWNINHEESDRSEEYFKNIKLYRHLWRGAATSYTEALTSPYVSTGIDQEF
ncbi:hypothetical protein Tsubulata_030136 [Turnera subulata]|uniref:F-box domain-containing protein n=1 Tax=Turnera subulata TaxID=218843 RepID=A0A9Q0FS00_9ROSI|nr:hypothetical protein Tsubulata_030136 [Turnera subulata]